MTVHPRAFGAEAGRAGVMPLVVVAGIVLACVVVFGLGGRGGESEGKDARVGFFERTLARLRDDVPDPKAAWERGTRSLVAPLTVTLVDAGAEPRARLRFQASVGAADVITWRASAHESVTVPPHPLVLNQSLTGGRIAARSASVGTDGVVRLLLTVLEHASVETIVPAAGEGTTAGPTEPPGVRGRKGSLVVDARGCVQACGFDRQGAWPSSQELEDLEARILSAVLPVPDVAVGTGARWSVESDVRESGLIRHSSLEFVLAGVEDGVATVTRSVESTWGPGLVQGPGLASDESVNLLSCRRTCTGSMAWPLDGALVDFVDETCHEEQRAELATSDTTVTAQSILETSNSLDREVAALAPTSSLETFLEPSRDGVALAAPHVGAEPIIRVRAGERLRWFERRAGFYRLGDTPSDREAWLAEDGLRTVEAPRAAPTSAHLKALRLALERAAGGRWVIAYVTSDESTGALRIAAKLVPPASSRQACGDLIAAASPLSAGWTLQVNCLDELGELSCR